MRISQQLKAHVIALRTSGTSYGQIAATTGLPRSTVKTICRRTNTVPSRKAAAKCPQCGIDLPDARPGQRFCSPACRQSWWHAHPEALTRTATYTFACATCGTQFSAYGNATRIYCTHRCYIQARFGSKGGQPAPTTLG